MPNNVSDIKDLLTKYEIPWPRSGASVGDGWLPLVEQLIVDLIAINWNKDCHQIKEKFGGLRFYIGEATEEMHTLIAKYEGLSTKTCEDCGGVASKHIKNRWMTTMCDDCFASWKAKP